MPESELLVPTYFVQYHAIAEDGETNLAFPFMVVHENDEEHRDGWVFAADERNTAGLSTGANWRTNIGRGGPGQNASWSPFEES